MAEKTPTAGPYEVVYADPPWHYAPRRRGTVFGAGVTDKYPTMSIPEIQQVDPQGADNSVLLIWSTMPYLDRCIHDIIPAWGYRYVTVAYTWIKTNPRAGTVFRGVGNYTKSNAELCLLAKRGRGIPRHSRSEPQVWMEPRREHSRKPDTIRTSIERLFGNRSRIELFARTHTPGWHSWGNQTTRF